MDTSRDAITALVFAYAERLDAGDLDGVAALFEGAIYGSNQGTRYDGAGDVRVMLRRRVKLHADGTPRTKHVTTNLVIEIDEPAGTATSRSYFTVLQATERLPLQPVVAGRYHDRFVRDGDRWRFAQRHVIVDLAGNLHEHLHP
jgi:3-phenylpropionate/cinnamic acid dioxygenase small subunit